MRNVNAPPRFRSRKKKTITSMNAQKQTQAFVTPKEKSLCIVKITPANEKNNTPHPNPNEKAYNAMLEIGHNESV